MPPKTPNRSKPVIGLTGSIGAGKTTVSQILGELGACVIDTDRLAHDALESPRVRDVLAGWWGAAVLDAAGRVDRNAVADRVFEHPSELSRLEGLLYPYIDRCRHRITIKAEADPHVRAIVIDAPKLYEAGLFDECDAVVVVDASESVRLARVAGRGWTQAELLRREKSLEPLDKKLRMADHVVVNNGCIAELRRRMELVFDAVLTGFTQKHS